MSVAPKPGPREKLKYYSEAIYFKKFISKNKISNIVLFNYKHANFCRYMGKMQSCLRTKK